MSRKAKIWLGVFLRVGIAIVLYAIVGSEGKNDEFKPQNEFKLDPWVQTSRSAASTCRSTRRCCTSSSPAR